MYRFVSIVLLVGLAGTGMAQKSEVREVGSFTGVKAAEGVDVFLKKGSKESVRVEARDFELSDVITEVSGSYLKVHLRSNSWRRVDVKVYVTYVSIDKVSASSAASIYAEGPVKAASMDVSVSSAASIELDVEVDKLNASASSAGDIELKGKAKSAVFDVSSAGEIDAFDLQAEKVIAEASSAGDLKISVADDLVANASSAGGIRYRGNPAKSRTHASSGGSVKKSD